MNCKTFAAFQRGKRNVQVNEDKSVCDAKNNHTFSPQEIFEEFLSKINECIRTEDDFFEYIDDMPARYFKMFRMDERLYKMFVDNLEEVLRERARFNDFKIIISDYPELAHLVYEYMLVHYIEDDYWGDSFSDYKFDLIEDILEPMADLERYQGAYFKIVRERYKDILQSFLSSFDIFVEVYNGTEVLKESFGICEMKINSWLVETFKRVLFEKNYISVKDIEYICTFQIGYEMLMNNLPALLHIHGLCFYGKVGSVCGPVKDLVENQYCCFEFDKN